MEMEMEMKGSGEGPRGDQQSLLANDDHRRRMQISSFFPFLCRKMALKPLYIKKKTVLAMGHVVLSFPLQKMELKPLYI